MRAGRVVVFYDGNDLCGRWQRGVDDLKEFGVIGDAADCLVISIAKRSLPLERHLNRASRTDVSRADCLVLQSASILIHAVLNTQRAFVGVVTRVQQQ